MKGLRRLDRGRGEIRFVDIASDGFDASSYGKTQADFMARIHARLGDGTWAEGMEVFRRAYAAVGLGWLLAPTGWPGLQGLSDAAYRLFARNRLRVTGRHSCADGHCEAPPKHA